MSRCFAVAAVAVLALACEKAETAPLYEKVPVERRDVVVTVISQGVIRPVLLFSVKSKAWGEIVSQPVVTGDEVNKGQLLTTIDPRLPQNNLVQAQASVGKAHAQVDNAKAQLTRSEALFKSGSLAETDYERAKLAFATANAAAVDAEANLQTAKDAMEDTRVRAPITGTVLELDAVRGTVISSPTLGGGTVILKMASLDSVQDSALVAETDVARVQPGMPATVNVDAYPNRPFQGTVAKILPQGQVVQNVTMFPVLIAVSNPAHLLRPGMNTEVRIPTGQRQGVLAVPNAALRTPRDFASAASVLGLDPNVVQQQVAAAQTAEAAPRTGGDTAVGDGSKLHAAEPRKGGTTFTTRDGRAQSQTGTATGGPALGPAAGNYIVFALRGGKIAPVPIRTGLTDQDYIEVTSGLTDQDTVLVLSGSTPR